LDDGGGVADVSLTYGRRRRGPEVGHGALEKILGAVPVVTAWRSAMRQADEGGCTSRVPKRQARNPENGPDALEAEVLQMFVEGDVAERFVVDPTGDRMENWHAGEAHGASEAIHSLDAADAAIAAAIWKGAAGGASPWCGVAGGGRRPPARVRGTRAAGAGWA
jgi:hypothetical protein